MRKALVSAVVASACVIGADAAGRQLLNGSTEFVFLKSTTSSSRVLFVHLPGILASRTSSGVVSVWRQYGDVVLVEYEGDRFNGTVTARMVANALSEGLDLRRYEAVVFIGSSMGGLVAYDTYNYLPKDLADFRFIVVDAPTGRADLQPPLDVISLGSYAWWAGPISNPLSSLYFKATFVTPREENIEAGVDRAKLAKSVAEQMSHPVSWSMDQNRYIVGHPTVVEGSLQDVRFVYVRSTRDHDTTRAEAFDVWNAATNGEALRLEVDSTHVGYAERPEAWAEGFHRAIQLVLSDRP